MQTEIMPENLTPRREDMLKAQQELMQLWSIVRGRKKATRNRLLVLHYARVEDGIKSAIRDLERQFRVEAQNKFYEGAR